MDQRIIDLYDEYTHSTMDRRVFLERLAMVTGSAVAAEAAFSLLRCNYAQAAIIPEGDSRLETGQFNIGGGAIKGYFAAPKGTRPDTADKVVIVVHENRGLNPHIKDVARRVALEGFFAMAPDFLAALGGTPEDEDKASVLHSKLRLEDAVATARTLVSQVKSRGQTVKVKVGAMGFCWGGMLVNALATVAPDLDAVVAYYGVAPKTEDVPKIKAALLLHYAALDNRVNATVPAFESALKAARIDYRLFMYEGANHAFNNDTSAERYNEAAAALAWQRSIAFLNEKLAPSK